MEPVRSLDLAFAGPGWEDKVKIDVRLTKMDIFFISHLIEFGLSRSEKEKDSIISLLPQENRQTIADFVTEVLTKSNLIAIHEKLKQL